MTKWIPFFFTLASILNAQVGAELDISKLVETVGAIDSSSGKKDDSLIVPKADTVLLKDSSIVPSKRPGLIRTGRTVTSKIPSKGISLYLGGGEGSPWFELGVIEAIEKYGVPVNRVVGAGWGSWIAAVWSEGYSPRQISDWLSQADTLNGKLFWNLGASPFKQTKKEFSDSWVAETGFPSFDFRFSRETDSLQNTRIVFAPERAEIMSGREVVAGLILQQPLLEVSGPQNTSVERLPWQLLLCDETKAKFFVTTNRPPTDQIMISTGMASDNSSAPAEYCGFPTFPEFKHFWPEDEAWMMVLSWPERNPNISSTMFRKELDEFVKDTLHESVWIRPHAIHSDSAKNAAYWHRLGRETMRSRLGDIKGQQVTYRDWGNRGRANGQLGLVQPAFDNISPELQNHLSSYWENREDWTEEAILFVDRVNRGGMYDSVNISLMTQDASDPEDLRNLTLPVLGIQARHTPNLLVRPGGFGSSIVGPHMAGTVQLRLVQQFEYNLKVSGDYGSWQKTVIPELHFSRVHGGDLGFYANVEVQEQRNLNLAKVLKSYVPESDFWIERENRVDANLQIHWTPDDWWILRSGVKIGQNDITTARTRFLMEQSKRPENYATVNSMDLFTDWQLSGLDSPFYFDLDQERVYALAGFRSLLIKTSGESSAPLYTRIKGAYSRAASMNSNLEVGGNASFGVEGRSGPDGWEYPDSLVVVIGYPTDYTIEDRFKMKVAATPFSTLLPIPQLNSFHFVQVGANFGIHRKGNGLWLFASVLHDYTIKNTLELPKNRLSLEPVFRLHYKSLEFLLGLHRTGNARNWSDFTDSGDWLTILQVGFANF